MKSISNRQRASRPADGARVNLKDAATSTRDGVVEMGAAAKELAQSEYDELLDQFAELRDDVLEKVAEKPFKSLLIAAGTGVLVGLLFRRW